jgi:hypothetical protein
MTQHEVTVGKPKITEAVGALPPGPDAQRPRGHVLLIEVRVIVGHAGHKRDGSSYPPPPGRGRQPIPASVPERRRGLGGIVQMD